MTAAQSRAFIGLYSLGVLAIGAPILRDVFELSRVSDTASHHVLVPFVTLALLYRQREPILAAPSPGWRSALAASALGIGLATVARIFQGTLPLTVTCAAIILTLIAGFAVWMGRDAFRRVWFPLCFLGFAVPLPAGVIEGATAILKAGSAQVVAGLLTMTRTPFHRAGYVFSFSEFNIEIADECSGIRSSIALCLTALLAGHVLLRTTWKKLFVFLIVFPLALVKNAIRITGLLLLALHVDPSFLTGTLHHDGGVVFFLLTLLLTAPVILPLYNSDRAIPENESYITTR